MNRQIEEIVALQIGKLILKTISDEVEKRDLLARIQQSKQAQELYSKNLDENGVEIPQ
jgi:hypothetical protein